MDSLEELKELLPDARNRIRLYDFFDRQCSQAIERLGSDEMERPARWDPEILVGFLDQLHESTSELLSTMALIGFWSPSSYIRLATLHTRHFAQWLRSPQAHNYPGSLQWYPLLLQHYSLGLGSVLSDSFGILRSFLEAPYPDPTSRQLRVPSMLAVDAGLSRNRELFKNLPGPERNFTPISEHLLGFFESDLEDVLFFGGDYEYIFDRFEILYSLQFSHLNERLHERRFWAPAGRFAWKFRRGAGPDPFNNLLQEASRQKDTWPPIRAGFFDKQYERFEVVVENYTAHLNQLPWH